MRESNSICRHPTSPTTSKSREELVCNTTCTLGADDANRASSSSLRLNGKIIDDRNSRLIATILALKEVLDQCLTTAPSSFWAS